ncbi:MAG: sigma-70 family RNA polymerase sigma factor [Bacteroidaceae bacterium]|nr:sigma-70 family RNA polymerase sigma factor [Bacteroidaceae bacterium]
MIVEKELIEQLQHSATREKAFTTLVRGYQEPLYWQIRRLVLTHDDANDVLQNTFLKAWTAIDSFRGEAKLSTWLYRIAINEALNFLERRKKVSVALDSTENDLSETLQSDPYFDGDETQLQLQQAISALPEKQQLVFNLKYFQEMKYEEMSQVLKTSVGALKASYHHAVKKISSFFEEHD